MSRFIIDETAPKQCLFFRPIAKELERRGHEVLITTRKYHELIKLQDAMDVDAKVIGEWSSGLEGKLEASLERAIRLERFILKNKIDGGISLSSVELARVIFGLNKPLFIFNDIPTLDGVPLVQSRLTLPLASIVFAPFCVPTREYRECGFTGRVVHFPCLDPVVWLKKHKVKKTSELNITKDKWNEMGRGKHIFLRESELHASYLDKKKSIVSSIGSKLKKKYPLCQFLVKKRYNTPLLPSEDVREVSGFDIQSYVAHSDLLVGGGGTLNIEAGYYGVPTLYCRPKMATYEKWMIEKGLGIKIRTVEEGVKEASRILEEGITWKERARKVFRRQHFPMKKIIDIMESAT